MLDGVEVCWSVAAGDSPHLAELSAAINDAAFDLAFSGRDIAPTAIKTSSTPGGVGDLLSFD